MMSVESDRDFTNAKKVKNRWNVSEDEDEYEEESGDERPLIEDEHFDAQAKEPLSKKTGSWLFLKTDSKLVWRFH